MGILEDIKRGNFEIRSDEEIELEKKLNRLFFLKREVEEEVRFLRMVMTRGQETQERKGLHCSAIIKPDDEYCLRCQVLSVFYQQRQSEDVSPELKRIFEEGNAIHEKWQRLFIRGGYSKAIDLDRTQYDKRYQLYYSPDIICNIDGERYVGEIKSMNTYAYRNMIEREEGVHKTGKIQLYMYMYLTEIHKGFTLCEDKNTQEYSVKLYRYSEDVIKPYLKRLNDIKRAVERLEKENKIPKRTCTMMKYGKACSCCMRDVCFGKVKERI